ncbi:hypothetical protein MPLDJ20_60030 [Mesorhizobium plurifarium]|uniref:Uncharacterized protein n=1 Tax=Mesorhizobium plurifarium TaxID=69974 RepID=A0A090GPQ8_MESPL|nr:hypothetical protein MPLDJ20_60030 [Mesorhizobium plurifarium]
MQDTQVVHNPQLAAKKCYEIQVVGDTLGEFNPLSQHQLSQRDLSRAAPDARRGRRVGLPPSFPGPMKPAPAQYMVVFPIGQPDEKESGIAPAPADDPPFEIPRPVRRDRPCAGAGRAGWRTHL